MIRLLTTRRLANSIGLLPPFDSPAHTWLLLQLNSQTTLRLANTILAGTISFASTLRLVTTIGPAGTIRFACTSRLANTVRLASTLRSASKIRLAATIS